MLDSKLFGGQQLLWALDASFNFTCCSARSAAGVPGYAERRQAEAQSIQRTGGCL